MTGAADPAESDAWLAARLLARDPAGLGGVALRAAPGPARDRWLAELRGALPAGVPERRLPMHIADERLLGGLDLTATLAAGRPVAGRGLLAEADGGIVVAAMAERMPPGLAARLAAALDTGSVALERDGLALRHPTRLGLVLLDEGIGDERPPAALLDRCAFWVELGPAPFASSASILPGGAVPPQTPPDAVAMSDEAVEALCRAALSAGIGSIRAPILAARAARGLAALAGRDAVSREDAATAARLVLAPRATAMPEPDQEPYSDAPEPEPEQRDEGRDDAGPAQPETLDEVVLEAVRAAIPPGLLEALAAAGPARPRGAAPGGSGELRKSRLRGRPTGTVRGLPVRGARLALVETLRAAAPWQPLRRAPGETRLAVRRDDLRVTRFKQRSETTTIFVVDASGSAAFQRLAEAKGAVELLLADCYVRRDRVALIAFRGERADLLLPPTRSLTRAKRSLAGLPGGGGTPLALAIEAAAGLAGEVIRGGGSPLLVFLTDGRANIARDGTPGRERAGSDALTAAALLRSTRAAALFVDTAPRPSEVAARLAAAMAARYLPLPSADAATLSRLVGAEAAAASAA